MNPSEFKAWFPDGEFNSLADNYVQGFLDKATPFFNVALWGAHYLEGLAMFVADRIVQSRRRASLALSPNNGATTEKHVGAVGTSLDSNLLNKQAKDTVLGTDYGRRYAELRDLIGIGGMVESSGPSPNTDGAFVNWVGLT